MIVLCVIPTLLRIPPPVHLHTAIPNIPPPWCHLSPPSHSRGAQFFLNIVINRNKHGSVRTVVEIQDQRRRRRWQRQGQRRGWRRGRQRENQRIQRIGGIRPKQRRHQNRRGSQTLGGEKENGQTHLLLLFSQSVHEGKWDFLDYTVRTNNLSPTPQPICIKQSPTTYVPRL